MRLQVKRFVGHPLRAERRSNPRGRSVAVAALPRQKGAPCRAPPCGYAALRRREVPIQGVSHLAHVLVREGQPRRSPSCSQEALLHALQPFPVVTDELVCSPRPIPPPLTALPLSSSERAVAEGADEVLLFSSGRCRSRRRGRPGCLPFCAAFSPRRGASRGCAAILPVLFLPRTRPAGRPAG